MYQEMNANPFVNKVMASGLKTREKESVVMEYYDWNSKFEIWRKLKIENKFINDNNELTDKALSLPDIKKELETDNKL